MKAKEAIARYNAENDSALDKDAVLRFLEEVERLIYTEVVLDFECGEELQPMTEDAVLIASGAYESLYVHWLAAQTAFVLHEYEKYTVSMQLFNEYYEKFVRWYVRNHTNGGKHKFTGF